MSDLPPPPPPPPGGYAQPVGQTYRVQANFGQRLGAMLIDGLVILVPAGIIFVIALVSVPTEFVLCQNDTLICEQPDGTGIAILLLLGLVMFAVFIWYWGTFEGVRGQTVGKKALGIKTIRVGTGEPIGFGRSIGRFFARYLSSFLCYLGYFWMLWDDNRQTWHDKIVDSQVIQA